MNLLNRLARLFRRQGLDDDLREEMETHLEMRTEFNERSGMASDEARQEARKQFGNHALIKEDTRRIYVSPFWEQLVQDVRYAFRSFVRTPGFTLVSICALALGIGSTTAVFTIVDRILFRSLPYPHEDRLVSVGVTAPLDTNEFLLAADYRDWQAADTPFESLGSFVIGGPAGGAGCDLTENTPERLSCAVVDWTFLPTLGVEPLLGRNFTRDEDRPNVPRVAILSYALWQSRFGANPNIIGRSISVDTKPVTVAGVLPATFEMPTLGPDDILFPQALDPASLVHPQTGVSLRVFGRLKPGISIPQAAAAMEPLFRQSLQWVPAGFRSEVKFRIRSLRDRQTQDAQTASWVLFGAVLTVLLIACANVTNLLIARGAARAKEFAMRAALGAGRSRLVRQMLTESLLLSIAGAVGGAILAWWLLYVFTAAAPAGIPRLSQATLDGRVLLFTVFLSLASGLIFGLAPAFYVPTGVARSTGIGAAGTKLRHALVSIQIAASLVLLSAAGLLIQTLWNFQNVPLGMQTENLVIASMVLGQRYTPTPARLSFFRELEAHLPQIHGMTGYAIADTVPLLPGGNAFRLFAGIEVQGRPRISEGTGGNVSVRSVTEQYFSTLGIPVLRGRSFEPSDRTTKPNVVIVSESLASRLFRDEDPLGKQMRWNSDDPWRTIVGVVRTVKNNPVLSASDDPEFYVPHPQGASRRVALVIRTQLPPSTMANSIRSAVAAVDPALPVTVETMNAYVRRLSDRPRFTAMLLAFFSSAAVLLAGVGLFGVIAFLVARRTQEIGVRMALGATSRSIVMLVLSHTMRWTLFGIVLGLGGAFFVSRAFRNLLFQVSEHDVTTFAVTVVGLGAMAVIAAWIPSRRASRIDPMAALRQD